MANEAVLTVVRRGKPGRPPKPLPGPDPGHSPGTPNAGSITNIGRNGGAVAQHAVAPIGPRLLDLHAAARYLGLSEWTVRDLEHAGTLPRIRVPGPNQRELRKLLFDRQDLDHLIEAWKEKDI